MTLPQNIQQVSCRKGIQTKAACLQCPHLNHHADNTSHTLEGPGTPQSTLIHKFIPVQTTEKPKKLGKIPLSYL